MAGRSPAKSVDSARRVGGRQPIQMISKIRMISAMSSAWKLSSPSVPGVEDRHAEGRIIAGRQYRRVPGFIYQVNNALHERIERRSR
jgi:hypothetical protein